MRRSRRLTAARFLLLLAVFALPATPGTAAAESPKSNPYYRLIAAAELMQKHRQLGQSGPPTYDRAPPSYGPKPDDDGTDDTAAYRHRSPSSNAAVDADELLPLVTKRLMGLFRCSGWGPSCSGGGGGGGVGYNSAADKLQRQQSGRRKHQRSYGDQQQQPAAVTTVSGGGDGRSGGSRRQTVKFEPFFALTSGTATL